MAKRAEGQQYYLGNKNLPVPESKFEWTPEMVEELEKCRRLILNFSKHFYIVSPDEGKQPIKLHGYQKRILKSLVDNRFNVVLASRQIGKTTLLTIFALWVVCFNEDQRVLLIANKEATAINIFKRIRLAYEMLPNYLKPGVVEYAKTGMVLENGSSIGVATTTSDAARGESVNCLLIDEAAFIPPEFMDAFWESVYPVISASKKSKILMLSTPNGVGNLFYDIYTGAVNEENGWHPERVDWWEVPGRDEKWKEMTIKALGSVDAFDQEFGNQFRSQGENSIDKEQLDEQERNAIPPILEDEEGNYKIYKERQDFHFYTIGVDVGEGIGRSNSVIQVVDITDLTNIEQVATYANNKLDPFNFAGKLLEIAREWGSPPLLIERNNCGAQVIDALIHTHHYEKIVKYTPSMGSFTEKADKERRLGIFSHTNSKYNSMANWRYWMNVLKCVQINDKDTLKELKTYIRHANGMWKKQSDKYLDDRVDSFVWSLFALDEKVVEQYYEVLEKDGNGKALRIRPLDWDGIEVSNIKQDHLYNKLYGKKRGEDIQVKTPAFLKPDPGRGADIDELLAQGWKFPGQDSRTQNSSGLVFF